MPVQLCWIGLVVHVAAGSSASTITSIFALESATPSSCLTTSHALCAPKINITVDSSCTVRLDNLGNTMSISNPDGNFFCWWSTNVPVEGTAFSISDIAKFDVHDETSILVGNFTRGSSPYLEVYIPNTKCTLRYRALTAPVAAMLGAAPKPGKVASCPAGQYLETQTDTKPSPCLPCPPGSYSPTPSSGRACIRCKAGTYTNGYGSTKCRKCPVGQISKQGSVLCNWCSGGRIATTTGRSCVACPANSDNFYAGSGPRCLGNAFGNVCCAAGDCKGQAACKGPRTPSSAASETYTATFQIVDKNVQQPTCKNATLLSCLPLSGKVQLSSTSASLGLRLNVYRTNFTCSGYDMFGIGGYSGTKSAYVSAYDYGTDTAVAYGLVSNASQGTVTMYLAQYISNSDYVREVPLKAAGDCSITLKLLNGYAFDLIPRAGAACDPHDAVSTYKGRKFCQACIAGQFRNSSAQCQDCPAGYYNDNQGFGTCKPCPAGYTCYSRSGSPSTCSLGFYTSKPKQTNCAMCPVNTFGVDVPTTKCTMCPKGTIAPEGASACGVPWDKAFPD